MAAALETSQHKSSDVVFEVCCSVCEDDGIYKQGLFYCKKCSKYFCDSCALMHNKFLKDHSIAKRGQSDNKPVKKAVDDLLELCEEHTAEKLTMFCEDDEKMLCHVCLLRNHKQCSHVILLTDKVKATTRPFAVAQMKTRIESLIEQLEDKVKLGQQNIMTLQSSYETMLEEIVDLRQLINDNLDRLQQNTERKWKDLHSELKNSLENNITHCNEFISNLKEYDIKDFHKKTPERAFIIYSKCLDQIASADLFLQKPTANVAIVFNHNKDIERFISSCTEFGSFISCDDVSHQVVDPNTVLSIKGKSRYNVRTATDKWDCYITGICETSNGKLVFADYSNHCVKLLDSWYNLIEQIQLPWPMSMCSIATDEMALAVSDGGSVNEINFLRVDKKRIVKLKTQQLNHRCYGIANHQSDLFVTSNNTVYQYTIDGLLVKKFDVYSRLSGIDVSPDGKKIYVTIGTSGNFLTLSRDGKTTASLRDPLFICRYETCNIRVAATGHVFVFGDTTVSQVDTDGKKVLNTTMKIDVDMSSIGSVFFSKDVRRMIVGFINSNVVEFQTKVS